ncbi:MAG: His/Gly/Thr/Pro-type tRNA ligase C-terminal domain-containing protein, partial [Candidatus Rickettsiella isopodorum]
LLPKLNSGTFLSIPDLYFITIGDIAIQKGLILAEYLRKKLTAINLILDVTGDGIKSQFKRADKSGARFALILGDDEVKSDTYIIKNLREKSPQEIIPQDQVIQKLQDYLAYE